MFDFLVWLLLDKGCHGEIDLNKTKGKTKKFVLDKGKPWTQLKSCFSRVGLLVISQMGGNEGTTGGQGQGGSLWQQLRFLDTGSG